MKINNLRYYDQLEDLMTRSGQLVMQYFRHDMTIFEKNKSSVVTNADLENEKFLKAELSRIFPDAGFCAEESGSSPIQPWMWVIDPIDGTRNFIKGIPHFCIMVALTHHGKPVVSAIYQPVTRDFYYAQEGEGLWCNGRRIYFVDRLKATKSAVVVCSSAEYKRIQLKLKENKLQVSRRYFGSAGMDAIYLVNGNIDLVIFNDIAWWDVAAGMLMIEQAGGLVCHYKKSNKKQDYGMLHAGNSLFFDDFSW